MKIRFLIPLVFLFFIQKNASGQELADSITIKKEVFNHSLGIGAGFTTGVGLSYRYESGGFGVQTTFAPYSDDYNTEISFGITFLLKLIEAEQTSLYLYQGNHYYYRKIKQDYYNDESTTGKLNNGFGFGIEYVIENHISLNIMGGYAGYDTFDRISMTGEVALYYKF